MGSKKCGITLDMEEKLIAAQKTKRIVEKVLKGLAALKHKHSMHHQLEKSN